MNEDHATGLPALLFARARVSPDETAVLQKRRGRWEPLSWRRSAAQVRCLALGLDEIGVSGGDVVALQMVMSSDAWFLDLAVQAVGARSAAIDPDAPRTEIAAALEALRPVLVAVDGLEQADHVLNLVDAGQLPATARLVTRLGADAFDEAMSFDQLLDLGRARDESHSGRFDELIDQRSSAEIVALTVEHHGHGQLVVLEISADAMLAAGRATAEEFALTLADLAVSVVPLAHTVERGTTYAGALYAGATIGFPETPASALDAVAELQPTFLHATPTFWRGVATGVQSRLARNTGIKRLVRYLWERNTVRPTIDGTSISVFGRFFRKLLGAPALRKLGMDQLGTALTTGAVMSASHLHILSALGLEVRRGYGSAHAMGLVALSSSIEGDVNLDVATTGVRMQLSDDGVVEIAGVTVSAQGWASTGDRARRLGEGQVRIVGPGSAFVSGSYPAEIESRMCSSAYIEHVAVFQKGDATHAFIQVDATAAGDWAQRQGHEFTTFESLCRLDAVKKLLEAELALLDDDTLEHYELLSKPLQRSTGELTINREINRAVVLDRSSASPTGKG